MSDWQVYEPKQEAPQSDWSVVPETQTPISRQLPSPNENIFGSIASAPYRIAEDAGNKFVNFLSNIPGYWDKAQTEIPGLAESFKKDPLHLMQQVPAGLAELGVSLANMPANIAKYATERLNLYPRKLNEYIQKARIPEETAQQKINQLFGEVKNPGEALLRGAARNFPIAGTAASVLKNLNPMKLTASNIAKGVVKEGDKQYAHHKNLYTQLYSDADKQGFKTVPYDRRVVNPNIDILKQYSLPKQSEALTNFQANPSLQNAQSALSELKAMKRNLEEQSHTRSLQEFELNKYRAASEAQRNIEQNLFKDNAGNANENLMKRYKSISSSYAEHVVPYKYHPAINQYKAGKILPGELMGHLKKGEFAAQKGAKHPEIFRRDVLIKAIQGAGILGLGGVGGLGAAYLGHKYLTGKNENT